MRCETGGSSRAGSRRRCCSQGATAVSRLGLWLADLAINQLIQETTAASELGAVQGTERSVCAAFELLSYVATLVFPQPSQFPILMLGSLAAVGLSALISIQFAVSWRRAGNRAYAPLTSIEEASGSEDAPLLRK